MSASSEEAIESDPVAAEPVRPGSTVGGIEFRVQDRIFFATDSSALTAEARSRLEKLAEWLEVNDYQTITIAVHCDERGSRDYNLSLGERRAAAARDYLILLGVDPDRLSTVSYGEEQPAVLGSTPEVWAQNRRTVFEVH